MLKRRFSLYIVGTCIIAFFALAYVGIRAYQNHVEFFSGFEVFQSKLDRDVSRTAGSDSARADIKSKNSVSDSLDQPPVKVRYTEASEIGEPSSASSDSSYVIPYEGPLVPQFIETPGGKVRVVYRPPHRPIKAGDAIPEPPTSNIDTIQQFWDDLERTGDGWFTVSPEDVPDHVPESEREAYMEKIVHAAEMGISVEELERRLASGELKIESAPLTPEDEKMVNAFFGARGEGHLINNGKQTSAGEGEYHQQISEATGSVSVGERGDASARSEASPVTDAPGNATQVRHGAGHVHEQKTVKMRPLTAESMEAQLRDGLPTAPADKAQQLIDQYGTEEGLRRLREMDPETARRFESDKSRPRRERRNSPTRDTSEDAASTQ